jgi:hypothetical protein
VKEVRHNNNLRTWENTYALSTVWQFLVVVIKGDDFHHTFTANTDMTWAEFQEIAYEQIGAPWEDVIPGYRISSESRHWVMLVCSTDWSIAIDRMREKIQVARTRAVSMELKNTVSNAQLSDSKTLTAS